MPLRAPKPDYATLENSTPQAVNLGASITATSAFVPARAYGQSIVGLQIRLNTTITQSSAAAWTVGALISELKIMKGNNTLVDPQSFAQLQRLYNALTSLTDTTQPNNYFNNPSSAGASGNSTNIFDIFLPLQFTTETPILITLYFKAYNTITNCTAGTVTATVTFLYSKMPVVDDCVKIVSAPAALGSGTDIDISQFFSDARQVNECWIDVTADANLNYQKFMLGSQVIYDNHTAVQLRAVTTDAVWMQSLAGFFATQDMPTVYPTLGSTAAAKPQLIINLGSSLTPTFYLFLKPY